MSEGACNRARSRARRLAVQAVYQCMVGGEAPTEVIRQFVDGRNTGRADLDYFRERVTTACSDRAALEALIEPLLDRPLVQLDPVEHAILLLSVAELRDRPDVPYRVVVDEAVELAKMFGADQSYKYVNAIVDKVARALRPSMLSEREIIRLMARGTGAQRADVTLGIGDDAAVLQPRAGHELVVCTDTLVAGVHFPDGTEPAAIGHKALAVNLSDLAAMGAEPGWALLALTLPNADEAWLRGFATGFSELAARFGVKLVGGDTTRGPLSVTVTALGQIPAGAALRRAGARPGDALCVSGTLGDAALALAQWRMGAAGDAALRARLDRPEPRVALGLALRSVAHAVIDVSDGLLADLQHMVDASGVGATVEVERLPQSAAFAAAGGTRAMQMGGGDDYELLFAVPADAVAALVSHGVTRIGTVDARPGLRCIDGTGAAVVVATTGYEHFA